MATNVIFEDKPTTLVKINDLKIGGCFLWKGKIYMKVRNNKMLRIRGDESFHDFEITEMAGGTLVEPLDAELKFTVQ